MTQKEKLAEEYVMVTLHDDNHAIRNSYLAGYNECEKTVKSEVIEKVCETI